MRLASRNRLIANQHAPHRQPHDPTQRAQEERAGKGAHGPDRRTQHEAAEYVGTQTLAVGQGSELDAVAGLLRARRLRARTVGSWPRMTSIGAEGGAYVHASSLPSGGHGGVTARFNPLSAPLATIGDVNAICPLRAPVPTGKADPKADLAAYDSFVVMGPIWASHPAPPVNSILQALPKGARVELRMVSGGGSSVKDKVVAHAESLGLSVTSYTDVMPVN